MGNVTAACPDAVGPLNYTRAAEEWSCFEGRVYNAQAHSCDKFGALEESLTKTKGMLWGSYSYVATFQSLMLRCLNWTLSNLGV